MGHQLAHPPWERYVSRLCVEHWSLDPYTLIKLMADIEALVATGDVTPHSIATVLRMAGVDRQEADATAPAICAAIAPYEDSVTPPPP